MVTAGRLVCSSAFELFGFEPNSFGIRVMMNLRVGLATMVVVVEGDIVEGVRQSVAVVWKIVVANFVCKF